MSKPALNAEIEQALEGLVADGVVRPLVGAQFPLAQGAEAMRLIDERLATGKVVLDVPGGRAKTS
jgi:NADPH2:quinone reductase